MPEFAYRALSTSGELVVGRVEASDRAELYRRIERMGQIPIDASDATVSEAGRFWSMDLIWHPRLARRRNHRDSPGILRCY